MTTTEFITSIISALCMIITAVLAWVSIYRVNRVNVSFTGTPLDKSEFDKAQAKHDVIHDQLFDKIGGSERGIESRLSAKIEAHSAESNESRRMMHKEIGAIGNDVAALKKEAELANQRSVLMDAKIDRLIERKHS